MGASAIVTVTAFPIPLTRVAFQRALASGGGTPGTMIYGNTVAYRGNGAENYAALGPLSLRPTPWPRSTRRAAMP